MNYLTIAFMALLGRVLPLQVAQAVLPRGPSVTQVHLVAAEFPPGHPEHGRPLPPPVIIDIEAED